MLYIPWDNEDTTFPLDGDFRTTFESRFEEIKEKIQEHRRDPVDWEEVTKQVAQDVQDSMDTIGGDNSESNTNRNGNDDEIEDVEEHNNTTPGISLRQQLQNTMQKEDATKQ